MFDKKEIYIVVAISSIFIILFLYWVTPYRIWSDQRDLCRASGYPDYLYIKDKVVCRKLENGSDILKPAEDIKVQSTKEQG